MHKWILLILLLGHHMMHSQNLQDYRWENRLLFILNPDSSQPMEHEQVKVLQGYENEIRERDLIVFIVTRSEVLDIKGNILDLEKDQIPFASYNGIILLGKDGGVKLKKPFVIPPQAIFDLIDGMPMRRAEMKKSKKY